MLRQADRAGLPVALEAASPQGILHLRSHYNTELAA
jgi:hypothetical protein